MKFSIIIPVYNVERWLAICLNSVLAQSCSDWECICVDDGSSDASGEILDKYTQRDARFLIIHQANAGVSSARNQGLSIASGDWVVFCDSDDYMPSDLLANFKAKLVADTNLDAVIFRPEQVDEYGHSISRQCNKHFHAKFTKNIVENIVRVPDMWCAISGPWAKAFRRKLIEENGIRYIVPHAQDEDGLFNAEFFSIARNVEIDYRITGHNYRILTGVKSVSRGVSWNKYLSYFYVIEKCMSDYHRFSNKGILCYAVRKCLLMLKLAFRKNMGGRQYSTALLSDRRFKKVLLPCLIKYAPLRYRFPALILWLLPSWLITFVFRVVQCLLGID